MPPAVKNPCIKCQLNVKENEKQGSMSCTVCGRWQHNACSTELTKEVIKFFNDMYEREGHHCWSCNGCNSAFRELHTRIGRIETKMRDMDVQVKDNTLNNTKINDKVQLIEKDVEDLKKSGKADKQDIIAEAKKAWSTEQRERESKKDALLLYGLAEPDLSVKSGVERKIADETQAGKLFKAIGVKVTDDDVKFSVRLGDLTDKVVEEPRPLKISFRKLALREDIFSKARNLQTTKFKDVSIVPDLTKQQRDEDKELRDEADRLNDQLSESDSLNWHYRCIGKRGERIICKLKVSATARGRGRGGHRGRPHGPSSSQFSTFLTNSNRIPINPRPDQNLTTTVTSSDSEEEPNQPNQRRVDKDRKRDRSSTEHSDLENPDPTRSGRTRTSKKTKPT